MDKLIHCRNSKCKNYYEDGCFSKEKMIVIDEDGKCESFEEGLFERYKTCEECVSYTKHFKSVDVDCDEFGKKVTYNGELCNFFKQKT